MIEGTVAAPRSASHVHHLSAAQNAPALPVAAGMVMIPTGCIVVNGQIAAIYHGPRRTEPTDPGGVTVRHGELILRLPSWFEQPRVCEEQTRGECGMAGGAAW